MRCRQPIATNTSHFCASPKPETHRFLRLLFAISQVGTTRYKKNFLRSLHSYVTISQWPEVAKSGHRVEDIASPAVIEHPRGIYPGRIDEKGRLKLPSDFQQYLAGIKETKVFCTTFDERIARLYPISKWKEIETMLREPAEDAEAAEDLWFTAMDLGGDAEMDSQGRLMITTKLRRALHTENKPVYLEHYKGHINVFGEAVYQERKQRARE